MSEGSEKTVIEDNPEETYRDRVSTIDEEGHRVWIYPRKPSGPLTRAREIVSVFLLLFLFGAPFIRINDEPFLLFNIIERKFVFFGAVFWPQDFYILVLATISLIVFIVLFTVVYGRLWCGWACPQTIFMEMVFRKIEYWIEGDARKQRELKTAPWDAEKIVKKTAKHVIFYGISFLIGNTFLAYIIGTEELFKIITDPPGEHLAGLTAMIIFSSVFYWVFAFFREQVCTMVCPYGRLQGVLLDANSIVVAYDFIRGEPRGKTGRKKTRDGLGDCVACRQCVDVCPTGIDIRNGTQLECINCTACIDACNSVMQKVNLPTGLIRYASDQGIKSKIPLKLTPRVAGYSFILLGLLTVSTIMFTTRASLDTTILRTPGLMYQEKENGAIANLYNLKVINKTNQEKPIELKLQPDIGTITAVGGSIVARESELTEAAFFIEIPRQAIKMVRTPVEILVYADGKLVDEIGMSFIGPHPGRKE